MAFTEKDMQAQEEQLSALKDELSRLNQKFDAQLKGMGLTEDDISMKGIGYKEIIAYFRGNYSLDEAVRLVKQNTRHLAKRQMTWFKRYEDIKWFNIFRIRKMMKAV